MPSSMPDPFDLGPPGPVRNIAAFAPGWWNDEFHSPAKSVALASNFYKHLHEFRPFVGINHEKGIALGYISGAKMGPGGLLKLDADRVPLKIREMMKSGQLTQPSIEFWEPGLYRFRNGTTNTTPILKCLTLLGNLPPAVRGLPSLSQADFPELGPAKMFANFTRTGAFAMDRTSILNALKAMGFPVDTITDVVPIETLQATLDFLQDAANGSKEAKPGPGAGGNMDPGGSGAPVSFTDRHGVKRTGTMKDRENEASAIYEAIRMKGAEIVGGHKQGKVKAFKDSMTGALPGATVAFLTPAQVDALSPMLLKLDDGDVKKFADGKTNGTELDEALAGLRATYNVPVKEFTEKAATAGGDGPNGNVVRANVVEQMLKGSALGQTVLAQRIADAKKV